MIMAPKKLMLSILLATFLVAGCNSDSTPATVTTSILSDASLDGDIEQTSSSYIITQGMSPSVQSVFAGIDPVSGNEYRAFLDFHLNGANYIPTDAIIDNATIELHINSITSDSITIPIRIDLVSFDQSILYPSDFDRSAQPALTYITLSPPISTSEIGTTITLDVTVLMQEAQNNGLSDFQVRILEDFGTSASGLIEFNDSTGLDRKSIAPYLSVTYH